MRGLRKTLIEGLKPHLGLEGPDDEFAYGDGAAVRKEGPDTQIRVDAATSDVSTPPSGEAVILPYEIPLLRRERVTRVR